MILMGARNFCHAPWDNRRFPKGVELSEKAVRRALKDGQDVTMSGGGE